MPGSWRRFGTAAVVTLATTLAACASLGESPEPAYATLVVENSSELTVNVYAVVESVEHRLGTIVGLRRGEFPIRRQMLSTDRVLRVKVEPMGEYRPYFSEPLPVTEGGVVELEVSEFIK